MRYARKFSVVMVAMFLGLIGVAGPGVVVTPVAAETAEVAEAPPLIVEEEVPPGETLETGEVLPTVEITPTGLITFDFRDAQIRDVLRLFARRVNINIVATPSVAGTVNMKLDNVKWRKALELILEVNSLKMTEDKENNVIKVMTEAEVAAEPMTTKVYTLNHLQAADYEVETIDYEDGKKVKKTKVMQGAAKMLEPLLAENEDINPEPGGNKLIVRATPATHEKLDAVLADLDKRVRQVLIEVRFIEASTEAGKNLGIKWDFLKEWGVEATGLTRGYTKTTDRSFETSAGESDISKLSERLSASGETTSLRSTSDVGRLSDRSFEGIDSFGRDLTRELSRTTGWDQLRTDATNILKTATLSADNLRIALSALLEDSDAKLISNPRIATVDNKQAAIRAVKEWPIPNYTYNTERGYWEVQGFDYKDIGITLRVTPHINENDFITLDVDPEVSNQAGVLTFAGGGGGTADIPVIDSRTATTRVIVKSGETLVIGGLVKTDELIKNSGVPLLKEIPLLGNLFKHTSKSTVNVDLMVFITPTIVEGPAAAVLAPPAGESETESPSSEAE
jgi:type IV pilus assembly protein PilQ